MKKAFIGISLLSAFLAGYVAGNLPHTGVSPWVLLLFPLTGLAGLVLAAYRASVKH